MAKANTREKTARITVENIGGISETELEITQGVTVLEGRNATNRTSFLQAIMGVMGSDDVTLKGDADEGHIELSIGDETYYRTLGRNDSTVSTAGEPYLEDPMLAELFAFQIESNEARRAVIRGDDLYELLMRPVDTDDIEAEIERLQSERDDIDDELDEIDSLKDELPSLEQRRTDLETDIEEKREELSEKEADIETMDAEVRETREEKRELETQLDELRDLRTELERVRSDIDRQQESINSLRRERSELRNELEELPDAPIGNRQHLDDEISRLRDRKQTLESKVSNLQNVIQFNEEVLEGNETPADEVFGPEATFDNVTDQLVDDVPVVCWTCGSNVARERIVDTLAELRSVQQDHLEEIRDVENELENLQETKREREQRQQRRESVEREISDVEDELDRRQSRLEELREQREQLNDDIDTTEQEVEQLESENFSEILDLHKEANQIEFELGQLESDLDDVTDRIAMIDDRLAKEDQLHEQRDRVREELEKQRTRIKRIEREAVDEFNTHMDTLLDILGFENLESIWIERKQKTVREGRRNVEKSVFELHVVRTTESGATYEDTVDHLSESEREVTGLTFALAGYLVHDVYESVPIMLLDSLEAIDSERVASVISYFSDHAQYLLVALLPEDAQAVSDEHTRITAF